MKIRLNNNELLDCFQANLASLSDFYGKEFYLTFAESWCFFDFDLFFTKDLFDVQFKRKDFSCCDFLNQYHGLQLKWIKPKQDDDLMNIIDEQINLEKPVLLQMDAYDCKWNTLYELYHVEHYVMVYDVDKTEKQLHCVDPMFGLEDLVLDKEDLKKVKHYVTTYSHNSTAQYDPYEILKFSVIKENELANMKAFREKIEFYMQKIIDSYSADMLNRAPFFLVLKDIDLHRENYIEMLKNLKKHSSNPVLDYLIEGMTQSVSIWKTINFTFQKTAMKAIMRNTSPDTEKIEAIKKHIDECIRIETAMKNELEKRIG